MDRAEELKTFYLQNTPGAKTEGNLLKAPCPICATDKAQKPGVMVAYLDPESFFMGYFRCSNRCKPGGYAPHFARMMGIAPQNVPGHDPDREPFVQDIIFPTKNLNLELKKFRSLMTENEYNHFKAFGVSKSMVDAMKVGYNGRYLVYPYFQEDGNSYAARCVLPDREEDSFWHGDETFFSGAFRIFNIQEIERCEDGALFITDGENNLLTLRELGYPGISVPSYGDLELVSAERLAFVNHVLLVLINTPEAQLAARSLATRLGFKSRILKWPSHLKRGYSLCHLAREKGKGFRTAVSSMVKASKAFSPFASPEREQRRFTDSLEREKGKELLGLRCGFDKMDQAMSGIRGINIMGGQPKAGKSCFFIQVSTEMARQKIPVIYYDFENGRQKIYTRTLCRLARLSEKEIRREDLEAKATKRLEMAYQIFRDMLPYFRVVTDRKVSPDIMRRQIDFLQNETRRDYTLVVVDSLHKLPFKDLSERRAGIDEWLRHMESIRDEKRVSFLVISELSRGEGGGYGGKPDLSRFKESGDIEYSADNAMILTPDWDPLAPISSEEKRSILWLVASRENSPGKIAEYVLEYPFWGFREM
ncbi:MAG: DnaB-like helicase C-terminal domain-containing protein [Desulfobacteraceae bacterium]|jgi:KaiC/GvpD/RAD55 family RecA-like ATPase